MCVLWYNGYTNNYKGEYICMQFSKIVCPVCGREYLPEEIFVPCKPKNIVRDNGKILGYTGDSFNLKETYKCDGCDATLRILGCVKFMVDIAPAQEDNLKYFFNEEYTSKFQRMRLAEE